MRTGAPADWKRRSALSFWFTTFWRVLDECLEATYWSEDHAMDIDEAHVRAAALRERNEELRGIAGAG